MCGVGCQKADCETLCSAGALCDESFGCRPNAECSMQPQQHSSAKFCCCSVRTRAKHSTKNDQDFCAEKWRTGTQGVLQISDLKSQLRKRASPSDAHPVDKHNGGHRKVLSPKHVHRKSTAFLPIRVLSPGGGCCNPALTIKRHRLRSQPTGQACPHCHTSRCRASSCPTVLIH